MLWTDLWTYRSFPFTVNRTTACDTRSSSHHSTRLPVQWAWSGEHTVALLTSCPRAKGRIYFRRTLPSLITIVAGATLAALLAAVAQRLPNTHPSREVWGVCCSLWDDSVALQQGGHMKRSGRSFLNCSNYSFWCVNSINLLFWFWTIGLLRSDESESEFQYLDPEMDNSRVEVVWMDLKLNFCSVRNLQSLCWSFHCLLRSCNSHRRVSKRSVWKENTNICGAEEGRRLDLGQ